tara:strand:+ start:1946 stop:2284 length:339 start_codon:yes stop_codon:yes gene_type:complete
MGTRYSNTGIFTNDADIYFHILEDRGLKKIVQYQTSIFDKMSDEDIDRIAVLNTLWKVGDRLYKLAAKHYGDPTYWWIIARFNGRPTDSHFRLGDVVSIPGPIETMLELYQD